MTELRERGVYALPNGRSFVAVTNARGGKYLYAYPLHDWAFPAYEVVASGMIYSAGRLTEWGIGDLIDTKQTLS